MKPAPPRIVSCISVLTALLIGCVGENPDDYKSFSEIETRPGKQITTPDKPDSDKPLTKTTLPKNATQTTTVETNSKIKPDTSKPVVAQRPVAEEPREIKILIPEKTFKTEGREKALRVSYDDINLLKVLNMEPVTPDAVTHMPAWLKGLDGKRIRIRGFMSPAFEPTGLRAFLMGRDNQACCFPGRAKVYDLFFVRMRDGETTDFIDNRPFDVVGVFHITPRVEEDDKVSELYQIDDAMVIEK